MVGLLLVFVISVVAVTYSLRIETRRQLMSVDSHVLSLLVQNQLERAEQEVGLVFNFETLGELEVWAALLETATADGVFAVQLYDLDGKLRQSSSEEILGESLSGKIEEAVLNGKPVTLFQEEVWLSRYVAVPFDRDEIIAVSDIYLPLWEGDGTQLIGLARYLMDGSVLRSEFEVLDTRLMKQAGVAIGLGGAVIIALFWMAWRKLSVANQKILKHAEGLKRANAELAMLAKTSALGSVTAHLIHGLKNPLAGLRQVVGTRGGGQPELDEVEWRGAREATDRMQRMIEEVVGVLQDSGTGVSFEMSAGDVLDELESRFYREVSQSKKTLVFSGDKEANIGSKEASIVLLIATNLVRNALEAIADEGLVKVSFERGSSEFRLVVSDDGVGISRSQEERLFVPTQSGKSGGAGIGLAISRQLAQFLGGDIRFVGTEGRGAVFELRFPASQDAAEG